MEWRLIETAPEEHISCLLAFADGTVTHGWQEKTEKGWRWAVGCEGFIRAQQPTHWMPWPEAPQ